MDTGQAALLAVQKISTFFVEFKKVYQEQRQDRVSEASQSKNQPEESTTI